MRKVLSLIVKDWFLNQWVIIGVWGGGILLIWLMFSTLPPDSPKQSMIFLISLLYVVAMALGETLAYHERSKGTLYWLRTLPVSDASIVLSKFLLLVVVYSVACFAWVGIFVGRGFPWGLSGFILIWLGFLCLGSFMLVTRLLFTPRIGQSLPFALLFLGLIGWFQLQNRAPSVAERLLEWVMFRPTLMLLEVAWIVGCALFLWFWMRGRETARLID